MTSDSPTSLGPVSDDLDGRLIRAIIVRVPRLIKTSHKRSLKVDPKVYKKRKSHPNLISSGGIT